MQQELTTDNSLTVSVREHVTEVAARVPKSTDSLNEKLQYLSNKAAQGDCQSQIRLEAINKLLDPCLYFHPSDLLRIKNKGYPTQVERGLMLYTLMKRLQVICVPVGDRVGAASFVKLIDFEHITWDELIDIRGARVELLRRRGLMSGGGEKLKCIDLLSPEEKYLYHKAKPYFGGRKKPTLKSVAISLLGEEDGQFSERNASNYIAAVKDFIVEHREELKYKWYFITSISSYNRNATTWRQDYAQFRFSFEHLSVEGLSAKLLPDIAQAMKSLEVQKLDLGRMLAGMFTGFADSKNSTHLMGEALANLMAMTRNVGSGLLQGTMESLLKPEESSTDIF
jgi:hypothetical protein